MAGYKQFSLKEMVKELGEECVKAILSNFSCPQNTDVEKFIKIKAIEFSKQNIAQTHLVFAEYKKNLELVGYFTLAPKTFFVKKGNLTSNLRRRVSKFGNYDENIKGYTIPAPLIAQLGKNFTNGFNNLITGDELLKMACDKIKAIQNDVGGKITYLECEDKPKLIEFYETNGFVNFGKRSLDKEEKDDLSGNYLIQLLKYLD
ncbi:MAG: N-acetyltransferase [Clostridium perfringens]|nr:N-acetyltransferase [Clostridium perfringens]MDU7237734.1 N-acetyltransferase [Clostridium perfringens]